MKVIFTFLLIFIFWLNATSDNAGSEKQKPAKQKTQVAHNTKFTPADSIPAYSINVNGQLNAVQITGDTAAGKSMETASKQKNKPNSIEINGEGNSVQIHQSKNGGHINIQQNENGNRVNISQSK